jgi:hypothetical protein
VDAGGVHVCSRGEGRGRKIRRGRKISLVKRAPAREAGPGRGWEGFRVWMARSQRASGSQGAASGRQAPVFCKLGWAPGGRRLTGDGRQVDDDCADGGAGLLALRAALLDGGAHKLLDALDVEKL